ncbi:MAG: hypothetical protein OEN56_07910 [Gemmatimonadota bacterium]|nr:hypothetical protein [Gemmatimonadota bacterium]
MARPVRLGLGAGALVLGIALGSSNPVVAQVPDERATAPPTALADRTNPDERRGWLRAVVGHSPNRSRVILGLWAMHPFEPQFPELDGTKGFGGLYGHWFGATFVNSYDERTYILGIERSWFELRRAAARFGAGYRVGLIAGYDERLFELAGRTPVLPFGGVLVWSQLGPVGVDAYYVYRAITLEASIGF